MLERRLAALDQRHADTLHQAARCHTEANQATEQLGKPFPHAQALTAARARAREIDAALNTLATEQQPAPRLPHPSSSPAPPNQRTHHSNPTQRLYTHR